MTRSVGAILIALIALCGAGYSEDAMLIIGHRGACGHRPEHTLESYLLAAEMGADYLEPDLVMTKDGVFICRHECEIGETTDAAVRFPERKRKAVIDGTETEGWFAEDFTLAEIKQLRAKERTDFRSHERDGQFEIPTFEEFLDLAKQQQEKLARPIGICPELKHSTHHAQVGLPMEDAFLALLARHGYDSADDLCIVQSFEIANLKYLAGKSKLRLLQLFDEAPIHPGDVLAAGGKETYADLMKPEQLARIAEYAWGIGPWKESILPRDQAGRLQQPNSLIADAHRAGLAVVVYTMRNEPQYLATDYAGSADAEYRHWRELGIDGLFTDFPDTAVRTLRQGTKSDSEHAHHPKQLPRCAALNFPRKVCRATSTIGHY